MKRGEKMKKELTSLLIKGCCKGMTCEKCIYCEYGLGCYLIDMIELIKKYNIKER